MASVEQLLIKIDASTEQLRRELANADKPLNKFERSSKAATVSQDQMAAAMRRNAQAIAVLQGPLGAISGRFSSLGSLIGSVNPLLAATTVGVAALAATMGKSVAVAEQFERATLKTEAVLRATGNASGQTATSIREMSKQIAAGTLASTQGVEVAAQKLLTFRAVSQETFRRTLELSQDLAELGFGSIEQAAVQLGKALEDPEKGLTALTRVGVSFSQKQKDVIQSLYDTGDALGAQKLLLDAVEKQVGGVGRAAAGGLTGAYDSLGQANEDLLEKIGRSSLALKAQTALIRLLVGAHKGYEQLFFPSDASQYFDLMAKREEVMRSVTDSEQSGNQALIDVEKKRLAGIEAQIEALVRLQSAGKLAAAEAAAAAKKTSDDRRKEQDDDRAKEVRDFVDALKQEVVVLRMSEAERGKREAADKAEKEARKGIVGIAKEQVEEIRRVAAATEAEKSAIKLAQAAAKEKIKEDERLLKLRQETVADLQVELLYQTKLLEAHGQGAKAISDVSDAHEVYLITQKLKLAGDSEEAKKIADVVVQINEQKRAVEKIVDAQKEAEKAAERLAKKQEAEAKKAAEAYQKVWDNAVEDVQRSLTDGIENALAGNLNSVSDFATEFQRIIRRLAANLISQQLVIPIVAQGAGLLGLAGPAGSAGGAAASAAGGGGLNLLSTGSSLYNIATGGPASLATSFATSGLGVGLGLSQGTAFAAGVAPVVGGATNVAAAGTAGLGALTGAGSALVAAAPYIAAAVALFALIGPSLFGGKPSVGPVGIADFSPGLGRKRAFDVDGIDPFTADNGGNGESLRPIAEAIADLIADSADRFSATIDQSLRFRVANYEGPESGSGRSAGFEVNGFIRGEAEKRVAEGLSQEQAVFEALKFAISEAFTFESATLQEIAASTAATTTEGLLADLQFGEDFDALSAAIADLGGVINANTLVQAQQTVAIQKQAEEFALSAVQSILDPLTKALELFKPIEGTGGAAADSLTAQADAIRSVVLDFDRGAVRGGTLGFDYGREGDSEFIRSGEDRFNIARVVSENREGTAFALQNGEGESVAEFDSMSALLAGAGAALADYNDTLAAQTDNLGRTIEEQARYDANLERIRTATGLATAGVELLVSQITGDFEPAVKGPFALALETGRANIDALGEHLDAVNEEIREANKAFPELEAALIDVTATTQAAATSLLTNLQNDFNDSITAQLNAATGLGGLNAIDALVTARDTNYADAAALGIQLPSDGPNDISRLFDAQLRQALNGASLADLNALLSSGQITDQQTIASITAAMADTTLPAFQAALQSSIASIDSEIAKRSQSVDTLTRAITGLQQGRIARALNPEISILDPQARMETALAEFERVRSLALGGDQDAIGQFDSAGDAALKAFVDYFGQTNQNTVDLFNRIQGDSRAIEDMTVTQIDLLQSQLAELQAIRASLDAAGGSGGQDFGANPVRNRILASLTGYGGDFGAGGFGQFLASSGLPQSILDQVNNIAGTINFANGGIMTGRGSLPLNMYSAGGVANSPQLAMYGEGRMPEAYVPLPDGRSIPVTVKVAGAANDDMREMAGALREIAGLLRTQIQISGIGAEGTVKGLAKVEEKLDGVEKRLRGAAA
jgi:hypothetical protein